MRLSFNASMIDFKLRGKFTSDPDAKFQCKLARGSVPPNLLYAPSKKVIEQSYTAGRLTRY